MLVGLGCVLDLFFSLCGTPMHWLTFVPKDVDDDITKVLVLLPCLVFKVW